MKHGTRTGYNKGCRCDLCKETQRQHSLAMRRKNGVGPRKIAEHGTASRYSKGCRCDPCRDAAAAYQRKWYAETGGRRRAWEKEIGRLYGLTVEDFNTLAEAQGHACAICRRPDSKRTLSVDHCHESGKVRGLLCGACNKALGALGDNEAGVMRAVAYLRGSVVCSD